MMVVESRWRMPCANGWRRQQDDGWSLGQSIHSAAHEQYSNENADPNLIQIPTA